MDFTDSIFDERPDMTELRHLKLPKSRNGEEKSLDVAERIGNSYQKVGGELLQDTNGNKVKSILADNFYKVVDTNVDILMAWRQGSGKRPVTWRTLIQVLEKCGNAELATDIRNALRLLYYNRQ